MGDIFPSILPDRDDAFLDDSYTESEVERMDYDTLRKHAASHPSEEVHGKMGKEDLRENLVGLERVELDESA